MEPAGLPIWAQGAGLVAVALVAAIVGVLKYLKTEAKTVTSAEPSTGAILSGSFIDSKLMKELIDTLKDHMEERGRDSKKTLRASQDLRDTLQELNETVMVNTDSTMNLMKFIRTHMSRPVNIEEHRVS